MALPIKLPVTARPTLTSNIFTSTWNVPTIGRYDFTNVLGNQNQLVLSMTGSSIYIIERVCFSTSLDEGKFQESIDSAISVPQLLFRTQKTERQIYDRPLPFINYVDNLELLLYVPGNQSRDEIIVTFQCVLNQIPATVSTVTIKAFLQLNIYEVQNTDWIRRFYHSRGKPEGDMSVRGRGYPVSRQGLNDGTFS